MEIKEKTIQQITLTMEESNILRNIIKELNKMDCFGVKCKYCPLWINRENSFVFTNSCLKLIPKHILKDYGYKESGNEE